MDVFTIVAVIVLALGLVAVHIRLSPLQMLVDERTARQRADVSRRDADAAEVASLLFGLRKLHVDYADLVRLERGTSEAIRRQLNAERLAFRAAAPDKLATSAVKLCDADGETTTVIDPPRYAARARVAPTREPLAHPDLIGCEDITDEAAHPRLGPDEQTPPRRGRTAMLVAIYNGSDEGDAS